MTSVTNGDARPSTVTRPLAWSAAAIVVSLRRSSSDETAVTAPGLQVLS